MGQLYRVFFSFIIYFSVRILRGKISPPFSKIMQIVLEHTRVINDRPGAGASESPSFATHQVLKMEATVKRWKDEIDKKGEWFEYEVGNDGRVKAVKCRLCTKYEHKLKWCRNFSNAFISEATAVKKDNVRKHAVSAMHI